MIQYKKQTQDLSQTRWKRFVFVRRNIQHLRSTYAQWRGCRRALQTELISFMGDLSISDLYLLIQSDALDQIAPVCLTQVNLVSGQRTGNPIPNKKKEQYLNC